LVGLLSVQGIGAKDINHPELPYVLAFLAGFSERFTLKMIDTRMNVLTSFEEKPEKDTSKKSATKWDRAKIASNNY